MGSDWTSLATGSLTNLNPNASGQIVVPDIDFSAGYKHVVFRITPTGGDNFESPRYFYVDNVTVIPEPGSLILLGISGLALGLLQIRLGRNR